MVGAESRKYSLKSAAWVPDEAVTLRRKFNTVTIHDKTTVHIIGKAEKIILLGSAKATLNGKEVEQTKDDKNQALFCL